MDKNDDDKRTNKEATPEGNISDFEISCQFGSWNLDEKNIKIGKNNDDKNVKKKLQQRKIFLILRYHVNLVHGIKGIYIKMEKNDDDKRVNKEATADENVFNFEISCQFDSWSPDEKDITI